MEIRLATMDDCANILNIIAQAQTYFKKEKIDQWQNNYPNLENIETDISLHHSYVLVDDDKVIGTAAIIFDHDPNYDYIEKGAWLSHGKYGVVHRIAIDENYKGCGLASLFFDYAKKSAQVARLDSLRVDTHALNHSMQRLIAKNGFEYCGIVYMNDGGMRFAYEYLLEKDMPYEL